MAKITVLLPAYNEEAGLALAVGEVARHLDGLGHEIGFVLVDDGSRDRTWEVIEKLGSERPGVVGLRFSRNFGKEAALSAGLDVCDGDCVIVMDSDLQHPPDTLPRLVEAWQKGFAIVHAVKVERQGESYFRRVCSRAVFGLAHWMSGLELQGSADFKLLDKQVVLRYREFHERLTFFRGLVDWLGFPSTKVTFSVADRAAGKSTFSLRRLAVYAVNAILSFSPRPLQIVSALGVLFFILSSLIGLKTLIDWLTGRSAEGFPTVILLVVGFGNVLMLAISVISWYVGKIYDEIKLRPKYVVSQKIGSDRPAAENG